MATRRRDLIEEVIRTRHPVTVGQLARMLFESSDFDETEYLDTVKFMVKDGSLILVRPSYEIYSVLDYLFTVTVSGELWLVSLLACLSAIIVYLLPSQFPLGIFRLVFGAMLICLPGYSTIELLFPSQLGLAEQLALSVGVTLAIVPIIGFILSLTPLGIRFQPIITSLAGYTIAAAITTGLRDYLALVHLPKSASIEEVERDGLP
jgi:uncharacterized membrane protein